MKIIKFAALCLFVCFAASCLGSLTPVQDALKQPDYPFADVPKNIGHAKPDPHAFEEKAIVVSVRYPDETYVGSEQYPLEILGEAVEKRLRENPSERQLIYLNADANAEFGSIVKTLDIIRRQNIENVGLFVEPPTGADKKLQVLKIKIPAEPKETDSLDLLDRRLVVSLQKDGKIKPGRFDKYAFKPAAPEISEEEISGKLTQMLKENEEKKITLKGTGEIDRAVFIKAPRANRYREVARLINAATAAGATEVYLMLDDLE
ncbi:MAG TPA: biopolymer transporter ExbD [Pyrinomonadaceae bacterium]|jgi:biopolymer transport protein ExbD